MTILLSLTATISLLAGSSIQTDDIYRLRFGQGQTAYLNQQLPFGVLNDSAYAFDYVEGSGMLYVGITGSHTLDGFANIAPPSLDGLLVKELRLSLTDVRALGNVAGARVTVEYHGWTAQAVPEPGPWALILVAVFILLLFMRRHGR